MAYVVNITSRAERDLAHLYGEINAEYSDAALKLYRGRKEAILSLEGQPNRCPVTRRSDKLRHLLYGRKPHIYRVIYRVLENQKQVEVLASSVTERQVSDSPPHFSRDFHFDFPADLDTSFQIRDP